MTQFLVALTYCLGLGCAGALAAGPFDDAAALWTMADDADVHGRHQLLPHGDVQFGVALDDADATVSRQHAGDGRVARINNGHLALTDDAALGMNPQEWTITIRLRDPDGGWNFPILGSYGSDRQVSFLLRAGDAYQRPQIDRNLGGGELPTIESWLVQPDGPRSVAGHSSLIEALWGADQPNAARVAAIERQHPPSSRPNSLQHDTMNGVMRTNFPVGLIGPTDWHDLTVRFTGPKLQLFIDGVLVDEEYPIGLTRARTLPLLIGAAQVSDELTTGFRGLIDHAAIWNRALRDEEVVALAGGPAVVHERELAVLGPEPTRLQYFRPRGHNRKAGDCIPWWDARTGTLRLFYLILRRNMHSKWDGGHGGLEIWQASTQDLTHWDHHPVTVPITEQWEAWNGTGAVAFLDGQYHWFYPCPDYDGQRGGIQHAVSDDGVNFVKQQPHPYLPGGDCELFRTDDGMFHLIKSGPVQQAPTKPLRDKTLVAWVRLAELDQAGGSAFTIEHPDGAQFDAVVFGERQRQRWMPGSNGFLRSPANQADWPAETSSPDEVVQIAISYAGPRGTIYRNGAVYASYTIPAPIEFPAGSSLLIGRRHTTAGAPAHLHGRVLDARLYDAPLTPAQLAALQPDVESAGSPPPLAWYDFQQGSLRDRTGTFPDATLLGDAYVENGELVVGDGGHFKVTGTRNTQVRLTSRDLQSWDEQPGAFIASDRPLAICPNVFSLGDWHYYICGSGVWKSRGRFGPWTEHVPGRLDDLAVPKTSAFGDQRRIYAGFLADDGWGGNLVLRELVQDGQGNLGTRFVPELIPASGDARTTPSVAVAPRDQPRQAVELETARGLTNYRLQMEVVPSAGAAEFGVLLRSSGSAQEDGCALSFHPAAARAAFSQTVGSSGRSAGGPQLEHVQQMRRPFTLDVIVRHDIIDAEIGEFRSLTTRYWNPAGGRLFVYAQGGEVEFRNIRVSPLTDLYEPYPGWRDAQADRPPLALNYHLMHPGGPSAPGDPNAAFHLDGTYHLHYILRHPWQGGTSFSFVHVTSPDMLHWTWQTTKLQPAFTGHGMFSGTGFLTKDGRPAAIYHGQASGRNQIAVAKDRQLSAWEKPYPVEIKTADGSESPLRHWDPDCFLIGDTYYAISGGQRPPLLKSADLKTWTHVGDFLRHELPDVTIGEDISCANFFPLGNKWMLLCISHPLGCRYYLGDWDARAEQFVPQRHGRMNWRREDQKLNGDWRDFFAPESVLTPDGRRVMWAWLASLHPELDLLSLQSLPRELWLGDDGGLRMRPLRELESLRYAGATREQIAIEMGGQPFAGGVATRRIAELPGDAVELRLTVARAQAERKRFGLTLFADGRGGGLPIAIRPETGTLRVGATEAPFAVADLPPGEDLELRVFVDKYLVEVFVNDRQALLAVQLDWRGRPGVEAWTYGATTVIDKLEIWRLRPTNQGFHAARHDRLWEPHTSATP